ncbi:unnamed protein product, partial [Musa acuminata subsp. burmannicoides]
MLSAVGLAAGGSDLRSGCSSFSVAPRSGETLTVSSRVPLVPVRLLSSDAIAETI